MAKILSVNENDDVKDNNPLKNLWEFFVSQDKFTKTAILTGLLIILITPFFVSNYLETLQRATGQNVVRFIDTNNNTITTTDTQNVQLMIALPDGWQLPPGASLPLAENNTTFVQKAYAQVPMGVVNGFVRNQSGAGVNNVQVFVRAGGNDYADTTNSSGFFAFSAPQGSQGVWVDTATLPNGATVNPENHVVTVTSDGVQTPNFVVTIPTATNTPIPTRTPTPSPTPIGGGGGSQTTSCENITLNPTTINAGGSLAVSFAYRGNPSTVKVWIEQNGLQHVKTQSIPSTSDTGLHIVSVPISAADLAFLNPGTHSVTDQFLDAQGNVLTERDVACTTNLTITSSGSTPTPTPTETSNPPARFDHANCTSVTWERDGVPTTNIVAGQTYRAKITMANPSGTNVTTWLGSNYYLGFPTQGDFGDSTPNDAHSAGTGGWTFTNLANHRIPIEACPPGISGPGCTTSTSPGNSHIFSQMVTAPATAGQYNFYWRMVNEGVGWFGEECQQDIPVQGGPKILQSIRIENIDTDGSIGGDIPKTITSGFTSILAQPIPWKLNGSLDGHPESTRTVQVTLSDGTTTVPYIAQITLITQATPATPEPEGTIHITSCQNITEPGNYVLDYDLADNEDETNTCFSLYDVSDVTLDCNNHSIFSSKQSTVPIRLFNVNNFAIKNCKISAGEIMDVEGWDTGNIYIDSSNNGVISNNTIKNYYIQAAEIRNMQFKNNTLIDAGYNQHPGYDSIIDSNTFTAPNKSIIAIWVSKGSGNKITNNVIDGNSDGVFKHLTGGDDGIVLGSEDEAGGTVGETHDLVQNNIISNEYDCGIETVGLVQYTTISNNTVTNTGVCGIGGWWANSLSNNTISNNIIDNSPSALVFFYAFRSDYVQTDILFKDNTFTNNKLVNIKSNPELTFFGQPFPIFIDLETNNIEQSNNVFSTNDVGRIGFPYFNPVNSIVDGRNNICTNGSYPNFPLICLGSTKLQSVDIQDLANKVNNIKQTITSLTDEEFIPPPPGITTPRGQVSVYFTQHGSTTPLTNLTLTQGQSITLDLYLTTGTTNVNGFDVTAALSNTFLVPQSGTAGTDATRFNIPLFNRWTNNTWRFAKVNTNRGNSNAGTFYLASIYLQASAIGNGTLDFSHVSVTSPQSTTALTVGKQSLTYTVRQ